MLQRLFTQIRYGFFIIAIAALTIVIASKHIATERELHKKT